MRTMVAEIFWADVSVYSRGTGRVFFFERDVQVALMSHPASCVT